MKLNCGQSCTRFLRALPVRSRSNSGFTLIELLIVLIAVSILVAIGVPSYLGYRYRAHVAVAGAHLHQARVALEMYALDHGTYAGATPDGLRATYDAGLPQFGLSTAGDAPSSGSGSSEGGSSTPGGSDPGGSDRGSSDPGR